MLGLRQTSIADMRLVNCYSRSVLGPSSLPSQFTELFGMGVKEAEAVLYGRCSAADSAFVSAEHRAWVRRFIGWPITKPTKRALKTCHTGVELYRSKNLGSILFLANKCASHGSIRHPDRKDLAPVYSLGRRY